jgi:hypothetical protein
VELWRQVGDGAADIVDALLPVGDEEEREVAKLPVRRVGLGKPAAGQIPIVLFDLVVSTVRGISPIVGFEYSPLGWQQ